MLWVEIRQHYPEEWLLLEAMKAQSVENHRVLEQLTVIATFADSDSALQAYVQLHCDEPAREYYVFHTSRETLENRQNDAIS